MYWSGVLCTVVRWGFKRESEVLVKQMDYEERWDEKMVLVLSEADEKGAKNSGKSCRIEDPIHVPD